MIDSSDYWRRLRDCGYASDEFLRQCDLQYKTQLARHILCVLLYHDVSKALTGTEEKNDTGITTRLSHGPSDEFHFLTNYGIRQGFFVNTNLLKF